MSTSTRIAVALVVFAGLGGMARGQVTKREYAGVQNFSQVNATVACGGATTPEAVRALKADGCTSIVNLRVADEPGANVDGEATAATSAGIRYFHLPFKAAAPDSAVVDTFLTVVSEPENQPVFIHCGTANRGSFVARSVGSWVLLAVHPTPQCHFTSESRTCASNQDSHLRNLRYLCWRYDMNNPSVAKFAFMGSHKAMDGGRLSRAIGGTHGVRGVSGAVLRDMLTARRP